MERILGEWTLEEIKQGLRKQKDGTLECCVCGCMFEPGEIFPVNGKYYDHARAAELHMQAHGGMFERLIQLDKKYTGLTENQAQLLRLMRSGKSDADIAAELGVSPSTVRHQRFMFREKAKQAKAYLALFELSVGSATPQSDRVVPVHAAATMVDDRYQITVAEEESIRSLYFISEFPPVLKSFPTREKRKIVVLRRIVQEFDKDRTYTELEVNEVLKRIFDDFATLRRYLVEYGFMMRSRSGAEYKRSDGGSES